ncbi:uncharacterized protein LOC141680379 [Apium graveolens]|uniref:uncharacterized protein LOC141680379 n=1 Tax=Apium graveolens TaxID=4045 RepID=UPI003D7BD765
MTVSSLLVVGENRWDEEVIYNMFEERDVNLILSIPLNQNERDVWYWRRERLGDYSIKSAYVLLQEQKNLSVVSTGDRCWKRLWALKLPPKVTHLIWRAAMGCFPTKVQIQTKHVNIDAMCLQCQLEPETIAHAQLTCSFAKECWYKLRGITYGGTQESFLDWLSGTFDSRDTKQRQEATMLCWSQEATMLCWSLWKCRNELVWNQRGSNCYNYSLVARNSKGELLHAKSRCRLGQAAPDSAEAMSVREALSWIKGQQYSTGTCCWRRISSS